MSRCSAEVQARARTCQRPRFSSSTYFGRPRNIWGGESNLLVVERCNKGSMTARGPNNWRESRIFRWWSGLTRAQWPRGALIIGGRVEFAGGGVA
eukprot:1183885-Prorocentrum_minimum.AAC.2